MTQTMVTFTDNDALEAQDLAQALHLVLQLADQLGVRVLVDHSLAHNLLRAVRVPGNHSVQVRVSDAHAHAASDDRSWLARYKVYS